MYNTEKAKYRTFQYISPAERLFYRAEGEPYCLKRNKKKHFKGNKQMMAFAMKG